MGCFRWRMDRPPGESVHCSACVGYHKVYDLTRWCRRKYRDSHYQMVCDFQKDCALGDIYIENCRSMYVSPT